MPQEKVNETLKAERQINLVPLPKPQFSFFRLGLFDNLELFSSQNEQSYFPLHFHNVFCISIITQGTEKFITNTDECFTLSGQINITNPHEVHRNSSALENIGYSYRTVYINPDVFKYFNEGKPVMALQRIIDNRKLYFQIQNLISTNSNDPVEWEKCIINLLPYQIKIDERHETTGRFSEIDDFIDRTKYEKFSLEKLSKFFHLSPYHFIRQFKIEKGITPQVYTTLRRLGSAQKQLRDGTPGNDVAWDNGFYDISHLDKAFKKYFGTTSATFVNSNILQKEANIKL